MDDEHVVEEIVTDFFLNTCRLRPQISKPVQQTAVVCAALAAIRPHHAEDCPSLIPLTIGSVANSTLNRCYRMYSCDVSL